MPISPTKLNRANVTKGRRVTLPPIVLLEEHDQIVFEKKGDGYYFEKINHAMPNASSKVLYGLEVGRSKANNRWYGIITDSRGIIKLRISSSSAEYLKRDLASIPDQRDRKRLDERCGTGWNMPIIRMWGDMEVKIPSEVMSQLNKCVHGLTDGTWPPVKE